MFRHDRAKWKAGGRREGFNRYLHRNTYVDIREWGKSTRASNKSGRISLSLSLSLWYFPFLFTAAALFAGPPSLCPFLSLKGYKLALVSLFLAYSHAHRLSIPRGTVPFLSPRRGAIVLTSIFYISLQPLNALTADIASNNQASRGISHARARHVQAVSIREYDTT